jgi:multiple sugar transport system permease protein
MAGTEVVRQSTAGAAVSARRRAARRGLLQEIARHWSDYLYVAPAVLLMALVIVYPFFYTIYLSFFNTPTYTPEIFFNGVENYQETLTDDRFWLVVKNTVIWTVGGTVGAFVLGFLAAVLVNRALPLRGLIRSALMTPYVIGAVVAAYAWRWLYHADYGVISGGLIQLRLLDRPILFLDSEALVMPSLIVTNIWKSFPFVMIMLLAGMQAIPQQLYNAARIDGAGRLRRFWEITVPELRSVIAVTTVLLFIANVNSFTLVWILTGGGPAYLSQILVTHIYTLSLLGLRFGMASAVSVLLFIILMAGTVVYFRALTRGGQVTQA